LSRPEQSNECKASSFRESARMMTNHGNFAAGRGNEQSLTEKKTWGARTAMRVWQLKDSKRSAKRRTNLGGQQRRE